MHYVFSCKLLKFARNNAVPMACNLNSIFHKLQNVTDWRLISVKEYIFSKLLIHFYRTLLIAGCDIGVQSSVRQHLRRSLVFSKSVRAWSVKPCIVIVLNIPFKHAPLPTALDHYISWSIDFVHFYVKVRFFSALVIAVSVKLFIVVVLDIPFKHTL